MGYDGTLKFDTQIDDSGFGSGVDKITSLASGGMKAVGAAVATGTTAIAGLGTAAITVGSNFESSMSNVAAISGATGKDLQSLTDKAMEMGSKTKFSASESADAFSYMAMAGWKTEDMLGGIEGIMNLAAASGEDLATTSDIVTDALTAFGLSAKDSTHFADVLAAASSNANTNVGLMGETFKYVAPVAGSLGFSAEDTAQAIGLMANAGIKGSMAGTSLRSIFTRLAKPTKDVQIAMDKLGISLTDEQGNVKGLDELMGDLRSSFSNLSEAEKAQYAAMIAGQQGMSGLLAIVNASESDYNKLGGAIKNCTYNIDEISDKLESSGVDWSKYRDQAWQAMGDGIDGLTEDIIYSLTEVGASADECQKYLMMEYGLDADDALAAIESVQKSMESASGAAEHMADIMNDNLQGQITILKSGLEGLGIKIYQSVDSPLRDVVTTAQDMVQQLTDAFDEGGLGALVNKAGDVFAQIVTEAAQAAPKLIDAVANLLSSFVQGIADNATDIGAAAAQVVMKLGEAISNNAPLLIQAAKDIIHGFMQGLSEEFPGVSALLDGFFDGFIDTLTGIVGGMIDIIKGIFTVINNMDPVTLRLIGEALGTIVGAIVGLNVAKSVAGSLSGLWSVLNIGKTAITGVAGALPKVIEGFALWRGGAGTLTEVFATQFPKMSGLVTQAVTSIKASVTSAATFFNSTAGGITLLISGLVMAVTNFVSMFRDGFNVVKEILMVVGIAIAAVGAVILGVPIAVAAAVAAVVAAIATAVVLVKEHWEEIKSFFLSAWEGVKAFFASIPERLTEFFTGIHDKAIEFFTNAVLSIAEFITNAWTAITTFLTDLPYKIGEALGFALGSIVQFGLDVFTWITETLPQIIEGIITWFATLPERIWEWLVSVVDHIRQWGTDISVWVTETLPQIIESIVQWFRDLPGKIWEWLCATVAKVVEFGANLLETGRQAAQNFFDKVVEIVTGLPGKMMELAKDVVNGIWEGIKSAKDNFFKNITGFFNGISDGFKKALGIHSPSTVMQKLAGYVVSGMTKGMSTMPKEASKIFSSTKKEFDTFEKNMSSKATTAGRNLVTNFVTSVSKLSSSVSPHLSAALTTVSSFGSTLSQNGSTIGSNFVTSITNATTNLPSSMENLGRSIVVGVWNGINRQSEWFYSYVNTFFTNIVNSVKSSLGINSPSKVFAAEVGAWIPPGVGLGVKKAMPGLLRTTEAEMERLADTMQSTIDYETGRLSFEKTGQQSYDQARDDRKRKQDVHVTGRVEDDRPIEVHSHLHIGTRELAEEIAPAVNHELYKIDKQENDRGRGN